MDNVIPFPEKRPAKTLDDVFTRVFGPTSNSNISESQLADVIAFPRYNRNMNLSKKQFAPKTENKAYIEGMREIRKSNAAGTHLDKRTKRARTRLDSKRKAIRESKDDG